MSLSKRWIRGVRVKVSQWDGRDVVGGLALAWSDGTEDRSTHCPVQYTGVQCTVYSTVYTVQYSVHCTVQYSVHCKVQCTLYCAVYTTVQWYSRLLVATSSVATTPT